MFKLSIKLLLTFICLAFVWVTIDVQQIFTQLISIKLEIFLFSIGSLAISVYVSNLRWRKCIELYSNIEVAPSISRQLVFRGFVLAQLLPLSALGDVFRIVKLTKAGNRPLPVTMTVVMEKVWALIGLLSICVIGLALTFFSPLVVFGMLILFVIILWWLSRAMLPAEVLVPEKLIKLYEKKGRELKLSSSKFLNLRSNLQIYAISLLGQIGLVAAYISLLENTSEMQLSQLVGLGSLIVLASVIPLTAGGWGLRELASVALPSLIGVEINTFVAASIAFGLVNLCLALMVGTVWIASSVQQQL